MEKAHISMFTNLTVFFYNSMLKPLKKAINSALKKYMGKRYQHIKFVRSIENKHKNINVYKPFEINYISPHKIRYATPVTEFVDYDRYTRYGIDHHHSGFRQNRGWFHKKRIGQILSKDWDKKQLKFNELNEYVSLYQFLVENVKWEDTIYAQRTIRWIEMGNRSRGFENVRDYLKEQPNRIMKLVKGIERNGVLRASSSKYDLNILHDISVNIGRNSDYFHNSQGYHRLSIAKILDIDNIPVLINTRYKID